MVKKEIAIVFFVVGIANFYIIKKVLGSYGINFNTAKAGTKKGLSWVNLKIKNLKLDGKVENGRLRKEADHLISIYKEKEDNYLDDILNLFEREKKAVSILLKMVFEVEKEFILDLIKNLLQAQREEDVWKIIQLFITDLYEFNMCDRTIKLIFEKLSVTEIEKTSHSVFILLCSNKLLIDEIVKKGEEQFEEVSKVKKYVETISHLLRKTAEYLNKQEKEYILNDRSNEEEQELKTKQESNNKKKEYSGEQQLNQKEEYSEEQQLNQKEEYSEEPILNQKEEYSKEQLLNENGKSSSILKNNHKHIKNISCMLEILIQLKFAMKKAFVSILRESCFRGDPLLKFLNAIICRREEYQNITIMHCNQSINFFNLIWDQLDESIQNDLLNDGLVFGLVEQILKTSTILLEDLKLLNMKISLLLKMIRKNPAVTRDAFSDEFINFIADYLNQKNGPQNKRNDQNEFIREKIAMDRRVFKLLNTAFALTMIQPFLSQKLYMFGCVKPLFNYLVSNDKKTVEYVLVLFSYLVTKEKYDKKYIMDQCLMLNVFSYFSIVVDRFHESNIKVHHSFLFVLSRFLEVFPISSKDMVKFDLIEPVLESLDHVTENNFAYTIEVISFLSNFVSLQPSFELLPNYMSRLFMLCNSPHEKIILFFINFLENYIKASDSDSRILSLIKFGMIELIIKYKKLNSETIDRSLSSLEHDLFQNKHVLKYIYNTQKL